MFRNLIIPLFISSLYRDHAPTIVSCNFYLFNIEDKLILLFFLLYNHEMHNTLQSLVVLLISNRKKKLLKIFRSLSIKYLG